MADDAWPVAAPPSLMRLVGKDVLVVAPALASRLQEWTSDLDPGIRAAQARLEGWLAGLAELGVNSQGRIGDADPRWAIADALNDFAADEIIIATPTAQSAHHRDRDLPAHTRQRYRLPTMHLTPDAPRPRTAVRAAA